jgi:hypothetical protein
MWALVTGMIAALGGCTATGTVGPSSSPPRAPVDDRPCNEVRPPGWVPPRPDSSRPFGTYATVGGAGFDDESNPPSCAENLRIEVDRLGSFHPTAGTIVKGGHRRYTEYRIVLTDGIPNTVWPIRRLQIVALDGRAPADRAVDVSRGVGAQPGVELRLGQRVQWHEAFSDDRRDQTVMVTPWLDLLGFGPGANAIFSDR